MATKQKTTKKGLRPPKSHSTAHHAKVYWPYIPLIALLIGGAFLNVWQPLQRANGNNSGTLAYATSMSRNALLSSTNGERASNGGGGALTLNGQLNAAAQAKANDMVSRDYWSHNTPDGNPPWVFIDAQGYSYQKAGENLAYGFGNSSETITGWMNSPSHRANMLDGSYTEVGFGFTDSANFVGNGNQTVVVAMYALPTAAAPPPAPAPTPPPAVQQESTSVPPAPTPEPEPEAVEEEVVIADAPAVEEEVEIADTASEIPVTTDTPIPTNQESHQITYFQQLTNGDLPIWTATMLSVAGFSLSIFWLLKHAVAVKRFVIEGEHFAAHHPIFDMLVVSIVAAIVYLSQSSGVIL